MVERAKGADLLVHEGYGPEQGAKQAHAFGHSTAADAGGAARAAGAKRLADTHIRSLAALDVHARIGAQLLAFARDYGEPLLGGGRVLITLLLTQTSSPRRTWVNSWAELAERAGIALSSLVRVENDQVDPRFTTIRKLAQALDVDHRELTKGS